MERIDSFIADHHFPGPPASLRTKIFYRVTPLYFPTPEEAVYRITVRSQMQWKSIWHQVMTRQSIHLSATLPGARPLTLLLILESPDAEYRLPLIATVEQCNTHPPHIAIVEQPSLSWRLAAVQMGRALPTNEPTEDLPDITSQAQWLRRNRLPQGGFTRPFRLRPDLPAPASALAIAPELTPVVVALRAGFLDLDELLQQTNAPPQRTLNFLAALAAADLLVDAPRPLMSTNDPFEYFAIHWSADDALIRRRYSDLKILANTHPDKDTHLRRLGIAFDLLCRPEYRQALRRARLHPPIISEVCDHLRRLTRLAQQDFRIDDAIALCHRVLELATADREFEDLLTDLQKLRSAERRASTP